LLYKNSYKYDPVVLIGASIDAVSIDPLETVEGVIAFEIPKEAALSNELSLTLETSGNTYACEVKAV